MASRLEALTDPGARERRRGVVDVERRFLLRVDDLRRHMAAEPLESAEQPGAGTCSLTTGELTRYLRGRFPSSPGLEVDAVSVLPGGRSKETILVTLSGTDELPREVVLRKDRPVGVLQTRAADEFDVLSVVHGFGGVPVPEPYFADDDGEGTLLVMERVPGRKAGEYFPDLAAPRDHCREIGRQLARSLGRLHALPLDRLAGTRLGDLPAAVTEDSLRSAIDGIVARIDGLTGPPCAAVYVARDWLLGHLGEVVPVRTLCLLQGDVGLHNTLVEGATVTALVDWEAATVGPPARELALAWAAATTLMPWPEFLDAYTDAGGPSDGTDGRAIAFYRLFGALGGFMMSRTGGHLFRTGAKRDLTTAHSGLDSQFRCARDLARALDDAMAGTL